MVADSQFGCMIFSNFKPDQVNFVLTLEIHNSIKKLLGSSGPLGNSSRQTGQVWGLGEEQITMQKACAKLMFLCMLFLIASVAWMPASAGSNGLKVQMSGTPSTPPTPPRPKPGPSAPDGGATPPTCGPSTCPTQP